MKVICINDKQIYAPAEGKFLIKEGETYEVIDTFEDGMPGWWWYELSFQPGWGYPVEFFIPLSEIDETEMIRNYQTEKA